MNGLFYLKFELGSTDVHAGAQTLAHHHAHMPDANHAAVQVALHAAQHALEQVWKRRNTTGDMKKFKLIF